VSYYEPILVSLQVLPQCPPETVQNIANDTQTVQPVRWPCVVPLERLGRDLAIFQNTAPAFFLTCRHRNINHYEKRPWVPKMRLMVSGADS